MLFPHTSIPPPPKRRRTARLPGCPCPATQVTPTMAPIPGDPLPRLVVYHQTTHDPEGNYISILPLVQQPGAAVTHIIAAAIHINDDANGATWLTLNDHRPADSRYTTLWAELRLAQACGIKVLGMLGGAAKGTYARLDQDVATFEKYYALVHDLVKERGLDGLDLDVEEEMSLANIVRLVDRLRADFGPGFIITLAPVAAALLDVRHNLSGFDYQALEALRGNDIAWYNTQFYCGWGNAGTPFMYQMMVARKWNPSKIVMGVVTTPENGHGYVDWHLLGPNIKLLKFMFPSFGGVMGWEYFNSSPGGRERPWEWAQRMTELLKSSVLEGPVPPGPTNASSTPGLAVAEADPDFDASAETPVPNTFDYHSDGAE